MQMDQKKYDLFVLKYKANPHELLIAYESFIAKKGDTHANRIKFYSSAFDDIVKRFKAELQKDEHFDYIITYFYTSFIATLEEDKADTAKYKDALHQFKTKELPSIGIQPASKPVYQEPTYKYYNLKTRYGRRKAREQAESNYRNGSPQYRAETDKISTIFWVIITILVLMGLAVKYALK